MSDAPIPCQTCFGEPVVAFERLGLFGYASGADAQCPDCKGARVAHCEHLLTCRGLPATRMIHGKPSCEGCADELARDSSRCGYCGDGKPVAPAGPERKPACKRCIDAFDEIGRADTVRVPRKELRP